MQATSIMRKIPLMVASLSRGLQSVFAKTVASFLSVSSTDFSNRFELNADKVSNA